MREVHPAGSKDYDFNFLTSLFQWLPALGAI